ncbi:hypothetical protein CDAR_491391 [Caerostris darwini]|uniref:Uncharacterized protein n=1 Tax=Caerostris darwini TaxID=1538125 RepID=A0AAV4X6N5_9ARAC|nr:hypothetical protein CDAR_491391 [Caerostris darwini]
MTIILIRSSIYLGNNDSVRLAKVIVMEDQSTRERSAGFCLWNNGSQVIRTRFVPPLAGINVPGVYATSLVSDEPSLCCWEKCRRCEHTHAKRGYLETENCNSSRLLTVVSRSGSVCVWCGLAPFLFGFAVEKKVSL